MKDFLKNKQKWIVGLVILGLMFVTGGFGVASYLYGNRCYRGYEVKNKVNRSDSNNVNYRYHNGNILKYSRSGISEINNEGKSLWNGGYEMKQPQVDVCGDYVSVADVSGKQCYIYNGKDEGVTVETSLPIVRAKVARQGVVAILLQDKDSNVLNIYNPYSNAESLLVEIPTNVSEEGYPLDFDISPDGKSVVTSYMIAGSSDFETKVSFYNFTEVGQDKNTLVGGKSFGNKMIADVEFVSDDEVLVAHEKGYSIFGQMKQPEVVMEKTFSDSIKSLAVGDDALAFALQKEGNAKKQTLNLYDLSGREKMQQDISYEYADMEMYGDEIIFTGNRSCNILRTNGHDKFDYHFEQEIDAVYPTSDGQVYTLIDSSTIQKIRLQTK